MSGCIKILGLAGGVGIVLVCLLLIPISGTSWNAIWEKGGHGMGGALIFPVLVERHNILYFEFCIL